MFVFLSKLLPLFVYPTGLACVLLVASLIVRRPRWRTALIACALGVLLLFGNRWVAGGLARSLEWQYFPPEEYPQADAIVLLGGATRTLVYPRTLSEVNEAGDRVILAAWLYHQQRADTIVVSGGYIDFLGSETPEAKAMVELLQLLGVPEEAIVAEARSRNTYENAIFVKPLLEEMGAERVLLVTSAMHMPRSVGIFAKQGIDVIPAPTDYVVTYGDGSGDDEGDGLGAIVIRLLPTAEQLEISTRAIKEYIGMVVYRLQGWM
jgi:uncharacterized SAM-binding protein YcdF (DUF218 family)